MPNYQIIKNYSLKQLTTIRVGGKALYYSDIYSVAGLIEIINFSKKQQIPFFILGKGSNILINDENYKGVVIRLGGALQSISLNKNNNTIIAGAGASLMSLGNKLVEGGYTECVYMALIPGTVGGAIRMNAGTTKQGEIKDHFYSALVYDPETDKLDEYIKDVVAFTNRKSIFSESKKIILQATFLLPQKRKICKKEARHFVKELLSVRHSKQPNNSKNFGSTFKHPNTTHSAGWYLERVDMKKFRIGGAMIAEEHANWIINVDNAKSSDVKKIIEVGQKRVFEKFGVQLEREVVYLPEDMETWK